MKMELESSQTAGYHWKNAPRRVDTPFTQS